MGMEILLLLMLETGFMEEMIVLIILLQTLGCPFPLATMSCSVTSPTNDCGSTGTYTYADNEDVNNAVSFTANAGGHIH